MKNAISVVHSPPSRSSRQHANILFRVRSEVRPRQDHLLRQAAEARDEGYGHGRQDPHPHHRCTLGDRPGRHQGGVPGEIRYLAGRRHRREYRFAILLGDGSELK